MNPTNHSYHRIGVDIDGVLADFQTAFGKMLCHKLGKEFPPDFAPKRFMWFGDLGGTPETVSDVWEEIAKRPGFWGNLSPLPHAHIDIRRLNKLAEQGHDIYFITNRPFRGAKYQTEHWLKSNGMSHPTVLICSDKGPAARSLQLTHFIDDLRDNCYSVLRARGVKTKCYLVNASYNEDFKDIYVPKVSNVTEFLLKEKLCE